MIDQSNIQAQCVQEREPATATEPLAGTDLAKLRIRVSFDFEVTANTTPILNTHNDTDVQAYDEALLASFLETPQSIDIMLDKIATDLGLDSPETFVTSFLPQICTESHYLFSEAIESLSGENRAYWRDIRDTDDISNGDLLSLFTESIFDCFSAEFVSSKYEVLDAYDE